MLSAILDKILYCSTLEARLDVVFMYLIDYNTINRDGSTICRQSGLEGHPLIGCPWFKLVLKHMRKCVSFEHFMNLVDYYFSDETMKSKSRDNCCVNCGSDNHELYECSYVYLKKFVNSSPFLLIGCKKATYDEIPHFDHNYPSHTSNILTNEIRMTEKTSTEPHKESEYQEPSTQLVINTVSPIPENLDKDNSHILILN